jgi:hypothetical protein
MTEEIRGLQTAKTHRLKSEGHTSRSSVDYPSRHERIDSPAPKGTNTSAASADGSNPPIPIPIDYVYLKNVLLQFLEQKDKKHQIQLIPVLGMLLHFDRYDAEPSCPLVGLLTSSTGRTSKNGCLPLLPNENYPSLHGLHQITNSLVAQPLLNDHDEALASLLSVHAST